MRRVNIAEPADLPLPCAGCGYDLRGNLSGRCPECGIELDAEAFSTRAAIPWQERQRVGRIRAFFRTVKLALRHPVQLARQAGRDVNYLDARRFQRICCVICWLVLVLVCIPLWNEMHPRWPENDVLLVILADGSIVLAAAAGLFLWLLTATGLPSYFFHPRALPVALQNRAIALSYYGASAPLVLVPLAAPTLYIGAMVVDVWSGEPPALIGAAAGILVFGAWLLLVAELLILPLILLSRGLHASGGRLIACAAVMLIGWPLLFVVFVLGLPLLVIYLQVAFHTLR